MIRAMVDVCALCLALSLGVLIGAEGEKLEWASGVTSQPAPGCVWVTPHMRPTLAPAVRITR